MTNNQMAEAAYARVTQHINRSVGQHLRAMRGSSIDAFAESMNECAAQRQIDGDKAAIIRDVICMLVDAGYSKKITNTMAEQLCSLADISVNLLNEG